MTIIETHTGGQPTRTVIHGFEDIPGKTMTDKYAFMQDHCDWVRTMVCQEPRGSEIMSGVVLTKPCHDEADVGMLHFEAAGWLPMCGHNTIGACTVLAERGLVPVNEPETPIVVDTPAGMIRATVTMKGGRAERVRFEAVPSFPLLLDGAIETPGYGVLPVEIGWGGSAVAFIESSPFHTDICPENAAAYERLAAELVPLIQKAYPLSHLALPGIKAISHLAFFSDEAERRHVVVGPDGHCDRSPCGNGTCARAAILHVKGQLHVGDEFVQRSVMGSAFSCRCLGEISYCGTRAIRLELSGRAWQTAESLFFVDRSDPLGEGFLLK